ncbi:MAG: hypothetical protein AAB874_08010 [Patescibacteria group bacterium]
MKNKYTYSSLGIIVAVFLTIVIKTPAKADFQSDYQGFLKTYDSYRSAHTQYLTTKNQYLQYGTLTAQNEALIAVKNFLSQRNGVLLSFISLLRLKNADQSYATLLNEEEVFLLGHQNRIPSVSTLDDSVRISQEAESRDNTFQTVSRKIAATIIISKVESLYLRYQLLDGEAQHLIQILKTQGKDTARLERWVLDAKNKALLAEQKLFEARNKTDVLSGFGVDQLSKSYINVQFTIFEAKQYITEALAFMTELKESIKYGDY